MECVLKCEAALWSLCVCSEALSHLLEAFTSHTITHPDTGQVGGVYRAVMSLMDSLMSAVGSWDCRRKETCCPHCSCLLCTTPHFC